MQICVLPQLRGEDDGGAGMSVDMKDYLAYQEGYEAGKRDAASPWHRVEDGLPEPMVRCLIWDGYEVDVAYFVRGFYNSKADWYWRKAGINRKGGKIPNREVKKWMPIEPPKEEEHGN